MKLILTAWIAATFFILTPMASAKNLTLTESDKNTWILCIKRVKMKPPCCGACKLLTQDDAKTLWKYICAVSPQETEKYESIWLEHKFKLLEEFKRLNPKRYEELYGDIDLAKK